MNIISSHLSWSMGSPDQELRSISFERWWKRGLWTRRLEVYAARLPPLALGFATSLTSNLPTSVTCSGVKGLAPSLHHYPLKTISVTSYSHHMTHPPPSYPPTSQSSLPLPIPSPGNPPNAKLKMLGAPAPTPSLKIFRSSPVLMAICGALLIEVTQQTARVLLLAFESRACALIPCSLCRIWVG